MMDPAQSPSAFNATKNGAVVTSVRYELFDIFGWMMIAWAGDRRLEKRKQLVSSVESTAHVWCNFDMLKKSRLCRADTVNDLFRKSEGFCSFFAQKSEGFCSFVFAQPPCSLVMSCAWTIYSEKVRVSALFLLKKVRVSALFACLLLLNLARLTRLTDRTHTTRVLNTVHTTREHPGGEYLKKN